MCALNSKLDAIQHQPLVLVSATQLANGLDPSTPAKTDGNEVAREANPLTKLCNGSGDNWEAG